MKHSLFILVYGLVWLSSSAYASSGPTNFQLTAPPIPSPSFSEGTTDSRLTGTFLHLHESSATFYGGGMDYKGRFAPLSSVAIGLALPASYVRGSLGDDFASATMNLFSAAPVLNVQWQAINSDLFSAIFFSGFNFNYGTGSIDQSVQGSSSHASITLKTYGAPVGIQLGVPIFADIVLSPFFSYTRNFGGTATINDSVQGSASVHIPGYSSHSFGMDVVLPKNALAIGTLIQNTLAAQSNEQNMRTIMLQLGWLFGVKPPSLRDFY